MKSKFMNIIVKIMSCAASIAVAIAVANIDTTCVFWSYQPDVPDELLN